MSIRTAQYFSRLLQFLLRQKTIALTNDCCTSSGANQGSERGFIWHKCKAIDLHSNLKSFAKFMHGLVDVVMKNHFVENLKADGRAEVCFGVIAQCPMGWRRRSEYYCLHSTVTDFAVMRGTKWRGNVSRRKK